MRNLYEINSILNELIYNNRDFFIKEMNRISFLKKIKIFFKVYKMIFMSYAVFLSFITIEILTLANWHGSPLDVFCVIFSAIIILFNIMITTFAFLDSNEKKDFLFFKNHKYYKILSKETLSLESYKMLSKLLSKEEFIKKTGDNDKISYEHIGVDSSAIKFFLSRKEDFKNLKISIEKQKKNKKLKGFIDQLYKEIS